MAGMALASVLLQYKKATCFTLTHQTVVPPLHAWQQTLTNRHFTESSASTKWVNQVFSCPGKVRSSKGQWLKRPYRVLPSRKFYALIRGGFPSWCHPTEGEELSPQMSVQRGFPLLMSLGTKKQDRSFYACWRRGWLPPPTPSAGPSWHHHELHPTIPP